MAQYVMSSVIQGLLGRQPEIMGSWDIYCSLNLRYLQKTVGVGRRQDGSLSLLQMIERTSSSQRAPVRDNFPKLRKSWSRTYRGIQK